MDREHWIRIRNPKFESKWDWALTNLIISIAEVRLFLCKIQVLRMNNLLAILRCFEFSSMSGLCPFDCSYSYW